MKGRSRVSGARDGGWWCVLLCCMVSVCVWIAAAPLNVSVSAACPPVAAPLPGSAIQQFVDPVPVPASIQAYRIKSKGKEEEGHQHDDYDWSGGQHGGRHGHRKSSFKPLTENLMIPMLEFTQQVLPSTFKAGPYQGQTLVWGYSGSYPGPTVEVIRGIPVNIEFPNKLPVDSCLQARLPRDVTILSRDFMAQSCNTSQPLQGPPFTTVHVHGGEQESASDGHPLSWYTPQYERLGPGFVSRVNHYPNTQPATTLFYHDHGFGVTRLNVFAGLAAFWIVRDPTQEPPDLPSGNFEVALALQDRSFDENGQLLYPQVGIEPSVHPFWVPEFFGDVIVVNGKAWPFLTVYPRRYRIRFVDGSNARFYNLTLQDIRAKWFVIGSDGGLLDHAVLINNLLMAPGERYDTIIDFSGVLPNTQFLLLNSASTPFPSGPLPDVNTTGRVLQFRVVAPPATLKPDTTLDPSQFVEGQSSLRKVPIQRITDLIRLEPPTPPPNCTNSASVAASSFPPRSACTADDCTTLFLFPDNVPVDALPFGVPLTLVRHLTLNENLSPTTGNSLGLFLDNYDFFSPITERPLHGSVELWELINLTGDAHPIHLHLVQFQILNRQPFNVTAYLSVYNRNAPPPTFGPPFPLDTMDPHKPGGNPAVGPFVTGLPESPAAYESGWKDTAINPPGYITRYAVRFAPQDVPLDVSVDTGAVNLYPFSPFLPFNAVDPKTGFRVGPGYVWHCHIIEHEDNTMMRPYRLETPINARSN